MRLHEALALVERDSYRLCATNKSRPRFAVVFDRHSGTGFKGIQRSAGGSGSEPFYARHSDLESTDWAVEFKDYFLESELAQEAPPDIAGAVLSGAVGVDATTLALQNWLFILDDGAGGVVRKSKTLTVEQELGLLRRLISAEGVTIAQLAPKRLYQVETAISNALRGALDVFADDGPEDSAPWDGTDL